MTSSELIGFFDERYQEVEDYLLLLQEIESAIQRGGPRISGSDADPITPQQMKILKSSVYLQLYNLVEATMVRCLEAVGAAIEEAERRPTELGEKLRYEWLRFTAQTNIELGSDKRLKAAIGLYETLVNNAPIKDFRIDPGGGGNWDDKSIEKLCERVGFKLEIPSEIYKASKRSIRDDKTALGLVKSRRNDLAHGSLSFVDCSESVAVGELRDLAKVVRDYLRATVDSFEGFIHSDIARRSMS